MKEQSSNTYLWDKWDTEFWWKSVLKRVAKKIFNEETRDIDELDNYENYIDTEMPVIETTSEKIKKAKTLEELKQVYAELDTEQKKASVQMVRERANQIQEEVNNE